MIFRVTSGSWFTPRGGKTTSVLFLGRMQLERDSPSRRLVHTVSKKVHRRRSAAPRINHFNLCSNEGQPPPSYLGALGLARNTRWPLGHHPIPLRFINISRGRGDARPLPASYFSRRYLQRPREGTLPSLGRVATRLIAFSEIFLPIQAG